VLDRLVKAIEEVLNSAEALADAATDEASLSPEERRLKRAVAALREVMRS
jgi:hypothetical protein